VQKGVGEEIKDCGGNFLKEVSPTPLSRTFAQIYLNRVVSSRIDG
jgi:hypothetical protein